MTFLFYLLTVSSAIILYFTVSNFSNLFRLGNSLRKIDSSIKISILISNKNDDENLTRLLKSIQSQKHKNFEAFVCSYRPNSKSNDLVKQFAAKDNRIKLFECEYDSDNLSWENFVKRRMARQAESEFIVFIDTRVVLSPSALSNAIDTLSSANADALTVFPTQKLKSPGENLLVPLINYLMLSLLPPSKLADSRSPFFISVSGLFFVIKKTALNRFSENQSISGKGIWYVEYARAVRTNGLKLVTITGDSQIYVKMYNNFREAFNGLTRKFSHVVKTNPALYLLFLLSVLTVNIAPAVLSVSDINFMIPVLLIVMARIIVSIHSHQNIFINVLLHIPQMFFLLLVGAVSIFTVKKEKIPSMQSKAQSN